MDWSLGNFVVAPPQHHNIIELGVELILKSKLKPCPNYVCETILVPKVKSRTEISKPLTEILQLCLQDTEFREQKAIHILNLLVNKNNKFFRVAKFLNIQGTN
jgi:hypothetical protein